MNEQKKVACFKIKDRKFQIHGLYRREWRIQKFKNDMELYTWEKMSIQKQDHLEIGVFRGFCGNNNQDVDIFHTAFVDAISTGRWHPIRLAFQAVAAK